MILNLITPKAKGARKILLLAVIVFLLHGLLYQTFNLPNYSSYVVEIFSLLIWFYTPFKTRKNNLQVILFVFILILTFALIGALLNWVFPINILLGFRALFMPMALFFGAAAYLSINDYHKMFSLFYKFQWLNLAYTLIKYFFFGLDSDLNNGALTGGAEQNFFCSILMTYYFYAYHNRETTIYKLIFVFSSSFIIAILQDEKFIFITTLIIGLVYFTTKKISFRSILYTLLLFMGIIFATRNLRDEQQQAIGSIQNAYTYSQKTGIGYGFPRIGSSRLISDMFFNTPTKVLFGIGLGKCTETRAPGVDISFTAKYGYLAYFLFTFQDVFLQTGWIGIFSFIGFFICIYIYNIKWKRKSPQNYRWLYDIAMTISIISIVIIWYNCTQRVYYAVLPYIILGMGPCITRTINTLKART